MSTGHPSRSSLNMAERAAVVAQKLRFLVAAHHVTVPDLAAAVGIKATTLQNILDGHSQSSDRLLEMIGAQFGVNLDFFLGGEKPPAKKTASSAGRASRSGVRGRTRADALTLRSLAIRHQALLEALIEKGVLTAADYNRRMDEIQKRKK